MVLASVYAGLFLASLATAGILSSGGHVPSPFDPPLDSFEFFFLHSRALRWSAFLQLGAAVPLGLFAATASSRLRFLGIQAAGTTIALFGGIGAAILLALSAAVQWALAWPDVIVSPATVRSLHLLAFATGGPAHVMLLGILLAGLAVTAGIARLLPRWMMVSGLVLAVVAELSWLSLVVPAASVLLPLARFPAFAWLIVAGALLPRRRVAAPEPSGVGFVPGRPATQTP